MTYKIMIGGDLFPVPSNFDKFSEGDISYLFGERICSLFKTANYRICNLEGALTDSPGSCEKTGPVVYAPTSVARGFKALGMDCCTLANNHITDAGPNGVIDTMKSLDAEGIKYIGAGKDSDNIYHYLFFNVGELRVCLYNVAETMYNSPAPDKPGAYLYDEYVVCKELETLQKQCDYIIVIYHGGAEKFRYPSPQTRKRFHRMVDSGANMILSQHTHCIGSEEYYKGAYLLYGQGNFLFRSFNNEFTDTGLIIELQLEASGPKVIKHLVNAVNDTVRYDENQDYTAFDDRSSRISDEEFVAEQYRNYCLQQLSEYLRAYKSRFWGRKVFRHFFPRKYCEYLLHSAYDRRDLLFTLHSLRSEQNRETAIQGIESLLGL